MSLNKPCKHQCDDCERPCWLSEGHLAGCRCASENGCPKHWHEQQTMPIIPTITRILSDHHEPVGYSSPEAIVPIISASRTTPLPFQRPSWHKSWMEIAHVIGERSYDPRMKVGAILVSEDNTTMLGNGYNGNYSGGPNTPESTEPGQSGFLHAEVNCLLKSPYHYHMKKVMYVTVSPCRACAKCIINSGVSQVIYDVEYRDTSGIDLLKSANVVVHKYSALTDT